MAEDEDDAPSFWAEVWPYIRAVKRHAWEAWGGLVLAALAELWRQLQPDPNKASTLPAPLANAVQTVSPWVFSAVAAFLLFLASFAAWRDERSRTRGLVKQLDASSLNVRGHINNVVVSDPKDGMCSTLIMLSVDNLGAPTVVQGFRVKVIEPNRLRERPCEIRQPLHDEVVESSPDADGEILVIDPNEFVSCKTHGEPIDRRGNRRGWLRCNIPAGLDPNFRLVVEFDDIDRKTYSCEYDFSTRRSFHSLRDIHGWPGVKFSRRPKVQNVSDHA